MAIENFVIKPVKRLFVVRPVQIKCIYQFVRPTMELPASLRPPGFGNCYSCKTDPDHNGHCKGRGDGVAVYSFDIVETPKAPLTTAYSGNHSNGNGA